MEPINGETALGTGKCREKLHASQVYHVRAEHGAMRAGIMRIGIGIESMALPDPGTPASVHFRIVETILPGGGVHHPVVDFAEAGAVDPSVGFPCPQALACGGEFLQTGYILHGVRGTQFVRTVFEHVNLTRGINTNPFEMTELLMIGKNTRGGSAGSSQGPGLFGKRGTVTPDLPRRRMIHCYEYPVRGLHFVHGDCHGFLCGCERAGVEQLARRTKLLEQSAGTFIQHVKIPGFPYGEVASVLKIPRHRARRGRIRIVRVHPDHLSVQAVGDKEVVVIRSETGQVGQPVILGAGNVEHHCVVSQRTPSPRKRCGGKVAPVVTSHSIPLSGGICGNPWQTVVIESLVGHETFVFDPHRDVMICRIRGDTLKVALVGIPVVGSAYKIADVGCIGIIKASRAVVATAGAALVDGAIRSHEHLQCASMDILGFPGGIRFTVPVVTGPVLDVF